MIVDKYEALSISIILILLNMQILLYFNVDFYKIHSLSAGKQKAEETRLVTTVTGKLMRRLSPPQEV
ncbi:hypothetical protein [Bacillus sp. Marseille-Q3570]|uniref:hypothetical protein n=1 Tax=Bacillus sp. Marseille-Q3570 TaxID=2963522 RepID=UPI0021B706F2|nr:hypothetical protein [Bacillus sp. Marseille-Q3570]